MSFLTCCWCTHKEDHYEADIKINVYQDVMEQTKTTTICRPPVLRSVTPDVVAILVTLETPKIRKGHKGSISSQGPRTVNLSEAVRAEAAANTPTIRKGYKGSISSQGPITVNLSEAVRAEAAANTPIIKRRFTFNKNIVCFDFFAKC